METIMRRMRIKYGITAKELADSVGLSHQYISDMELGRCGSRERHTAERAFEEVIELRGRKLAELASEYAAKRDRLLDLEDTSEL